MIDLEELKRLRADFPEINLSNFDVDDVAALNGWGIEVTLILSAILAKLEAAQRLRDALDGQVDGIADAIDAFDAVVKK